MNLITFTFDIVGDEQAPLVKLIEKLQSEIREEGFVVSLFREVSNPTRLMQTIITERSVEELTSMIHQRPQAKAVFEKIKESESRLVLSIMEQVL